MRAAAHARVVAVRVIWGIDAVIYARMFICRCDMGHARIVCVLRTAGASRRCLPAAHRCWAVQPLWLSSTPLTACCCTRRQCPHPCILPRQPIAAAARAPHMAPHQAAVHRASTSRRSNTKRRSSSGQATASGGSLGCAQEAAPAARCLLTTSQVVAVAALGQLQGQRWVQQH